MSTRSNTGMMACRGVVRRGGRSLVVAAALLLAGALTASGAEWFVATNGVDNADPGRGQSWTLPFATISNAVAYATTANDIVTVSNGLHEIDAEIVVTNAITVRSFSGDPATTIVRRRAAGSNLPRHRIFNISNANARVNGLTTINGYVDSGPGAGIFLASGMVSNCIVRANTNAFNSASSPRVCGGGICMTGDDAHVTDSTIEDNTITLRYQSGGGIFASKGLIERCIVRNNRTLEGNNGPGGGIWASGTNVLIRNCLIYGNSIASAFGGGVAGGTIENSLIYSNSAPTSGGGIAGGTAWSGTATATILRNSRVFANRVTSGTGDGAGAHGCTVINSTIHDNIAGRNGGGVYNCGVTNSIVYFNTAVGVSNNVYGGSMAYSCTYPAVGGTGNTTNDPRFADPAAGNYELTAGSPCIDQGLNAATPAGTDLAGKTRIQNGTVDMGALEYGTTPLTATFTASPTYGLAPFTPTFTAAIYGGDTNGASYQWDFDNNGSYEQSGADKQTTTHTYNTAGRYSVKLRVTNGGSEEFITVRTNYIAVGGMHYVATNGGHNPPFASWGDAATNIQAAVDVALPGARIVVSNGLFLTDAEIAVTNAVTIESLNGPTNTTVRRRTVGTGTPQHRIFNLSVAGSTLSGLRIENGYGQLGAGAYVNNGLVTNCVVVSNGIPSTVNGDSYAHGAGLYVTGPDSRIADSIIERNTSIANRGNGAGIFINGGIVERCIIRYNTRTATWEGNGSGVRVAKVFAVPLPIIRNCLIHDNYSNKKAGAILGGVIENCTIVSNRAISNAGGVGFVDYGAAVAGEIVNSVVYDNTSDSTTDHNYDTAAVLSYSCTTPDPGGTGNITTAPLFAGAATNNYRLIFGSPGIDQGTNLDWMATGTDLDGRNRILNSVVDMGAYEFDAGSAPLSVTFSGAQLFGYESLQVVFTASVIGSTAGLGYAWNFGDGAPALTGPNLAVVTNTYGPGQYTVQVTVTNSLGEIDSQTRSDYVLIKTASAIYVATNGASVQPYATWGNAATNLAHALALATTGTVVSVSNGVYDAEAELTMDAPFSVLGVNGPAVTTVRRTDASYYRVFKLNAAGALLAGFTIRDGSAFGEAGSGVGILAGTVSNCLITANNAPSANNSYGGGAFLGGADALLTHSTIVSNKTQQRYYGGGGIYATAGEVRNCEVAFNTTPMQGNGGGILAGAGVPIRNCLIRNNTAGAWAYGGGVCTGLVENCTVVSNTADYNGGGTYGSSVTNSIVHGNTSTTTADHNWSGGSFAFSCTTPDPGGTGNTTADPLFAGAATNNYRLIFGSPCIDKGTNVAWTATATDLDGRDRVLNSVVDMGAYEFDRNASPLGIAFHGAPLLGHESLQVVFTTEVVGATTGLRYSWDFGDGAPERVGTDLSMVTNTFGPGQFTVRVSVTNNIGESNSQTRTDYVLVKTTNAIHVATNGANVQPYATWGNAATNLSRAFALATTGAVVFVSNGLYDVTSEMILDFPGSVIGVNGRDVTIARRSGGDYYRLLTISNAAAEVRGLTLSGGSTYQTRGGGVYMTAGILRDCTVSNNTSQGSGGGIYMSGGIVSNCLVRGNTHSGGILEMRHGGGVAMDGAGALLVDSIIEQNRCTARYDGGGGVYVNAGSVRVCIIADNTVDWDTVGAGVRAAAGVLVENCVISGNSGASSPVSGGGVSGGRLRNCLIVNNTIPTYGGGAHNAALENCTVVSNRSTNVDSGEGGGVYGGTVTNSIVYFNWSVRGTHNYHGSPVFAYSCTTPDPGGTANIQDDPLFIDTSTNNFRLQTRGGMISPCIDKGIELDWMATGTDLDGNPRIQNKSVDMGAYETKQKKSIVITFH